MKVSISETSYKEISLSDQNVYDVTRAKLLSMVYPGEFLRTQNNGIIDVMQEDPHSYHGTPDNVWVRNATDDDIAIFRVLALLV